MPEFVSSVNKRFADRKDPLGGDAHDQECFKAEENVLHGIEKIREEDDVDVIIDIFGIVHKHKT